MELSSEDTLRLNVLLANRPKAIRIDESSMTLYGLSEKGEAKIKLNPTVRDDLYLKLVRELLAGNALGSAGSYPTYLQRWSRMGQTRDENLEHLLLLGEPEAVVAVACASGLTSELASHAWWTLQSPDNARRMLRNPAVAKSALGEELASFLIEYLPFETEPEMMIENLRLALQPGLIDQPIRIKLWERCQRKPTYYLGFLASTPDDLPGQVQSRTLSASNSQGLRLLVQAGNVYAAMLAKVYSSKGQTFLRTVSRVMEKPANQEVVSMLLEILRNYFSPLRPEGDPDQTLEALMAEAETLLHEPEVNPDMGGYMAGTQGLEEELEALLILSGLGYGVVRPVLSRTDAIGSLMRRKLEPVFAPLRERVQRLRGGP